MTQKNREIEFKFLLGRQNLQRLIQSPRFKGLCLPGSGARRHLLTSYYDTPARSFMRYGVVFRVRDKGDGTFEATVKRTLAKQEGLSERMECNLPIVSAEPDLQVLADFRQFALGLDLAAVASSDGGLVKLFASKVERTTYLLKYHDTLAEMAVDKGELLAANGKSEPIEEVELELMAGDAADLSNLYAEIGKVVPIRAEQRSKFARGLSLLEGKSC